VSHEGQACAPGASTSLCLQPTIIAASHYCGVSSIGLSMEEVQEKRLISRFEKYDQLLELQNKILAMDDERELSRDEERDATLLMHAVTLIVNPFYEDFVFCR
jgi:hypothetical protein